MSEEKLCTDKVRDAAALRSAASALMNAAEMMEHNENIFKGRWKKGSKAWSGEFIVRTVQDGLALIGPSFAPSAVAPIIVYGGEGSVAASPARDLFRYGLLFKRKGDASLHTDAGQGEIEEVIVRGVSFKPTVAPVSAERSEPPMVAGDHPRGPWHTRDEIELFLRDAYAAGCSAAQSRSLFTAMEYAAREAPKLRAIISASIEIVGLLNTAATHLKTWVLSHRRGSKDMAPYANTEEVAQRLDYFIAHGELPPARISDVSDRNAKHG